MGSNVSNCCFSGSEIIPALTNYGEHHQKFDTDSSTFFIDLEKNIWKLHKEKTALELDYMVKNIRHIISIPHHPNILKPKQCIYESDTTMAIQMPLAEKDLFEIISEQFNWNYVTNQLNGIADAIHFLHQCGAAHRDIKPENIVKYDGRLHLIDFDFCYPLSSLTHCGTEHFKCPKSVTSTWDCPVEMKSKKMDVYSFGKLVISVFWQASNHDMVQHRVFLFKLFHADYVKDMVHPFVGAYGQWCSLALLCISKDPPSKIPIYLTTESTTSTTVNIVT